MKARLLRTFTAGLPALLVACAAPADSAGPARVDQRARVVADAWRAALQTDPLGRAWRAGFVPLQALTVLPPDLGAEAAAGARFELDARRVDLPPGPGTGSVRFEDGSLLEVPVEAAGAAYSLLSAEAPFCVPDENLPGPAATAPPGGPVGGPVDPPCTRLPVTGVVLGSVELLTSRGTATVPAWQFLVAGRAAPLSRVAVRPDAVSRLPEPAVEPLDTSDLRLAAADRIVGLDADRLSFTVGVGACASDVTGLVYESADVLVIGGTYGPSGPGRCRSAMVLEPVSVPVTSPSSVRAVLDIVTGRALLLP